MHILIKNVKKTTQMNMQFQSFQATASLSFFVIVIAAVLCDAHDDHSVVRIQFRIFSGRLVDELRYLLLFVCLIYNDNVLAWIFFETIYGAQRQK